MTPAGWGDAGRTASRLSTPLGLAFVDWNPTEDPSVVDDDDARAPTQLANFFAPSDAGRRPAARRSERTAPPRARPLDVRAAARGPVMDAREADADDIVSRRANTQGVPTADPMPILPPPAIGTWEGTVRRGEKVSERMRLSAAVMSGGSSACVGEGSRQRGGRRATHSTVESNQTSKTRELLDERRIEGGAASSHRREMSHTPKRGVSVPEQKTCFRRPIGPGCSGTTVDEAERLSESRRGFHQPPGGHGFESRRGGRTVERRSVRCSTRTSTRRAAASGVLDESALVSVTAASRRAVRRDKRVKDHRNHVMKGWLDFFTHCQLGVSTMDTWHR